MQLLLMFTVFSLCWFAAVSRVCAQVNYLLQAVGEPPLFLASSVYFAIKDAIRIFRKENGSMELFELMVPATAETIRMACQDQFTKMVRNIDRTIGQCSPPYYRLT